jgi:tetratricopeptide (TPR) repeat protein
MSSKPTNSAPPHRIDGWKSIARYLGRDRTTAMRWAANRGLPVHQVPGGKRASVYALGRELDDWLAGATRATVPELRSGIDRRTLIVGGIVAGTAGTGIAFGLRNWRSLSPEVPGLLDQARLLLYQNTRETQNQAIGLCREAVKAAPRYADVWGMLGYANAYSSHARQQTEGEMLRQQARMAGQSALDLDPANALGELALADALPFLGTGDWLERDRGLRRALANRPGDPDVLFSLGYILRFTGHVAEAAAMCARIQPRQLSPVAYNVWIRSLWSAGRIEEALGKIERAASLYPSQRTLWQTRLEVLMFSGMADQAAAVAHDEHGRPANAGPGELAQIDVLVKALQDHSSGRIEGLLHEQRRHARSGDREAVNAIRIASVTGHLDEAFAISEAYFFSRGFAVGESLGNGLYSALNQRRTNFLFEPPAAPMRADSRFAALTEELGLERFWRESGQRPDYRRIAVSAAV